MLIIIIHIIAMNKSPVNGLDMLMNFFKTNYFEGEQVKPNDFSDFAAYFTQKVNLIAEMFFLKSIIPGCNSCYFHCKRCEWSYLTDVFDFLLELLKNNETIPTTT